MSWTQGSKAQSAGAQASESGWAWPFQDAMGVALMLLILRQFQLPSIKARRLLLLWKVSTWAAACARWCDATS